MKKPAGRLASRKKMERAANLLSLAVLILLGLIVMFPIYWIFRTHVTKDMQEQAANVVGGFMEDILGKGASSWQKSEKPVMAHSG